MAFSTSFPEMFVPLFHFIISRGFAIRRDAFQRRCGFPRFLRFRESGQRDLFQRQEEFHSEVTDGRSGVVAGRVHFGAGGGGIDLGIGERGRESGKQA